MQDVKTDFALCRQEQYQVVSKYKMVKCFMEMLKAQTCCFTGHRDIPTNQEAEIFSRLIKIIEQLYSAGVRNFIVGGAVGFDMLAAEAVINFRRKNFDVFLLLVKPCSNQVLKSWNARDKTRYEKIQQAADEVICLSENYYRGCMHKRNREMVDKSGFCVCYLRRKTGGTVYTVNYARESGLSVVDI